MRTTRNATLHRTMASTWLALILTGAACGAPGEEATEQVTQALLPQREGIPETQVRAESTFPGAAYFNDILYVSYIGTDSRINVMRRVNGVWYKTILQEWVMDVGTGSRDVALSVYQGQLYLSWLGTDPSHTLNVRRSSDGINWPDSEKFQAIPPAGEVFHYPQTMVVYGDRLNVFLQVGYNTFKQFVFNSSKVLEATAYMWNADADMMSAAVLGNDLVLGWQVGNARIKTKKFVPGNGWSLTVETGWYESGTFVTASTWPPSLMYVGFTDENRDWDERPFEILILQTENGTGFRWRKTLPDTSRAVVRAIRATAGEVEFAWVGKNSTLNVNVGGVYLP